MPGVEIGDFGSPDETRAPDKTTIEIVRMGSVNASRMRLEPGWRWSECVKPIAGGERCANFLVEAHRPIERNSPCSLHETQIVHDVATAGDKHALVSQRRKPLAGFVMELRWLSAVDAQLDDGNVRTGVRMLQHRPGAMVESPRII